MMSIWFKNLKNERRRRNKTSTTSTSRSMIDNNTALYLYCSCCCWFCMKLHKPIMRTLTKKSKPQIETWIYKFNFPSLGFWGKKSPKTQKWVDPKDGYVFWVHILLSKFTGPYFEHFHFFNILYFVKWRIQSYWCLSTYL